MLLPDFVEQLGESGNVDWGNEAISEDERRLYWPNWRMAVMWCALHGLEVDLASAREFLARENPEFLSEERRPGGIFSSYGDIQAQLDRWQLDPSTFDSTALLFGSLAPTFVAAEREVLAKALAPIVLEELREMVEASWKSDSENLAYPFFQVVPMMLFLEDLSGEPVEAMLVGRVREMFARCRVETRGDGLGMSSDPSGHRWPTLMATVSWLAFCLRFGGMAEEDSVGVRRYLMSEHAWAESELLFLGLAMLNEIDLQRDARSAPDALPDR